eukprot:scaffold296297_cov70-Cyclotella_meneghiniana.AAC.1
MLHHKRQIALALRPPLTASRPLIGIHNNIRKISIGWGGGSKSRRRRILARSSGRLARNRLRRDNTPIVATQTSFSLSRFLNPWNDLSRILPSEDVLYERVESTTRTFGIVAALMGSLSAALLTMNTYDGYDTGRVQVKRRTNRSGEQNDNPYSPLSLKRRDTMSFVEHVTFTHHVSGTSLLVSWECMDGGHSCAMPALLGLSTTLAGTALFIGIDREHGTPVSYIGLAGSVLGS